MNANFWPVSLVSLLQWLPSFLEPRSSVYHHAVFCGCPCLCLSASSLVFIILVISSLMVVHLLGEDNTVCIRFSGDRSSTSISAQTCLLQFSHASQWKNACSASSGANPQHLQSSEFCILNRVR